MKRDRIESIVELHEDIKSQYDKAMGFIDYTEGTSYEHQHATFRRSAILMKTLELITGDELLFLREQGEAK